MCKMFLIKFLNKQWINNEWPHCPILLELPGKVLRKSFRKKCKKPAAHWAGPYKNNKDVRGPNNNSPHLLCTYCVPDTGTCPRYFIYIHSTFIYSTNIYQDLLEIYNLLMEIEINQVFTKMFKHMQWQLSWRKTQVVTSTYNESAWPGLQGWERLFCRRNV